MTEFASDKILQFQEKLLTWYAVSRREFPWRMNGLSQYELIIAEVLLQRTKADTVAKFYSKFIEDFPGWHAIAYSNISKLEEGLQPIGLYRQRAARLLALAREMINRGGKIPNTKEELAQIPFMGQYISNAVLLIIHGQRLPLIDVNMARVLERYFGERRLADIRHDPYLQNLSLQFADHPKAKELSWAILDFAALVCKARKPTCEDCFLALKCAFYSNGNLTK